MSYCGNLIRGVESAKIRSPATLVFRRVPIKACEPPPLHSNSTLASDVPPAVIMIFRSSHGIGCWSQLRLTSLGGQGHKLAPATLERVAGSIGIVLARLRAGNGWPSASLTPPLCHRTYANKAVSRPKAHTGRTTSAPRKKAATRTATKSAAQPKRKKAPAKAKRRSGTGTKSRSKAGRPRKTTRAKPKAKSRTKKPLSEATKSRLEKKKKAAEVRQLKQRALSPPSGSARGNNTWTAFLTEQKGTGDLAVGGSITERIAPLRAKYRALSPAQREVRLIMMAPNKFDTIG